MLHTSLRPILAVRSGLTTAAATTRTFRIGAVQLSKQSSGPDSTTTPASTSTPASSSASTSGASTGPGLTSGSGVVQGSSKPLVRETSESPEELDARPLPYLSFALGVATPPTSSEPTWAERRERLVSEDHRMASRREIVKQATRGYFHDFHAIKSHGGKTWRAPNTLIKDERALYFPRIQGSRLSDRAKVNTAELLRGKVSIIALLGSKISEEHTKSTYAPALEAYATHPNFQLVQINLQSNPLKSYLVSLFLSTLRTQIAPELHATYLLSSQNLELQHEALGLHNKHVGYTYLVDHLGRIRWAAGAFAEPAEAAALKACTSILLDRAREAKKPKK